MVTTGLSPILATLIGLDLWVDFPAWPWTCLHTVDVPAVLGSWLNLAALPGSLLPECCGAGSWLVRPLPCWLWYHVPSFPPLVQQLTLAVF